jgi:hypothetical protein
MLFSLSQISQSGVGTPLYSCSECFLYVYGAFELWCPLDCGWALAAAAVQTVWECELACVAGVHFMLFSLRIRYPNLE